MEEVKKHRVIRAGGRAGRMKRRLPWDKSVYKLALADLIANREVRRNIWTQQYYRDGSGHAL